MKTVYKKALAILLLLLTTSVLSAATTSQYFTKSVVVTKVFPHKMGYKVFYMTNDLRTKEAYLPSELFNQQPEDSKMERSKIFEGYDKAFPYMTIFWKDGAFSHVKLYVKIGFDDPSWGVFSNPNTHDENFKNAELKFDF